MKSDGPPKEALLVTIVQAAKALQIPPKSLYELAARGQLPGVHRFGRSIRISLTEALAVQPAVTAADQAPRLVHGESRRLPRRRTGP